MSQSPPTLLLRRLLHPNPPHNLRPHHSPAPDVKSPAVGTRQRARSQRGPPSSHYPSAIYSTPYHLPWSPLHPHAHPHTHTHAPTTSHRHRHSARCPGGDWASHVLWRDHVYMGGATCVGGQHAGVTWTWGEVVWGDERHVGVDGGTPVGGSDRWGGVGGGPTGWGVGRGWRSWNNAARRRRLT